MSSTISAVSVLSLGLRLIDCHRQGHSSSQDQGEVLVLSLGMFLRAGKEGAKPLTHLQGNRRHASIPSRKEDTFRSGSKEDHGSRWTCQ